jgi:SEC-C motif domain protein
MDNCSCGSLRLYADCCEPYLKKRSAPKTPEALMRSRYTAFTHSDIQYIADTMRGKAKRGFSFEETYAWASSVQWESLSVLQASSLDAAGDSATVEFEAFYHLNGIKKCMHEVSVFHLIDGVWYYCDSKKNSVQDCPKSSDKELGRNDPCSCGSGKKYKKCCL